MRSVDDILNSVLKYGRLKNDAALARGLGVKPNTISMWRKRKNFDYELLITYCEQHDIPIGSILTGQIISVEVIQEGVVNENQIHYGTNDEFVYIPQVNGRISAGGGRVADDSIEVKVAFRREWVQRKGSPKEMVLIRVVGDSMSPTLEAGDLVLVNRGRNYIEPEGGVYAIALDDAIMVKRVQILVDAVRIISDNPKYPPMEVPAERIKVNGKVIWFAREMEK